MFQYFFILESNNLNFSVSNEVKIENLKIENNNVETINNLNLSSLSLFYSFFKDKENIIENYYNKKKLLLLFMVVHMNIYYYFSYFIKFCNKFANS